MDGVNVDDGNINETERRAVYVISVAAELAGVHPQTLRIYERKGLLAPQRTAGRSRRYSDADIRLLQRIQELTTEGVGLSGVKRIIELEGQLDTLRAEINKLSRVVEDVRSEARAGIADVHRQYRRDLVPMSKTVVRFTR